MKGEGTLSIDDFGYVMMTLNADAASAALLTKAGIPMEKNRFFTWGKTIVDKRNQTLKYRSIVRLRGAGPRCHGRADGPQAPVLLERGRQYPDADDEGRERQASVRGQMAETVRHRPRRGNPYASRPGDPDGLVFDGTDESVSTAGHFSKSFRSMASAIRRYPVELGWT